MKCTIPGPSVKVFGRAVQSLSKIGDELYMEPVCDGLDLKTVNSSRSAFSTFHFDVGFFHYFDSGLSSDTQTDEIDDSDSMRCKVSMKSCFPVFKSLISIEKTVEKCVITMDMNACNVVIYMYCRYGIVRVHKLPFLECEKLAAILDTESLVINVTAPSKLLTEAFQTFHSSDEEVSLRVNSDGFFVKNYLDGESKTNPVRTEIALEVEEFDKFQVPKESNIIFSLREIKAMLFFTELGGLPIAIKFSSAGKPVVFEMEQASCFRAKLIVATLAIGAESEENNEQNNRIRSDDSSSNSNNNVNNRTDQQHQEIEEDEDENWVGDEELMANMDLTEISQRSRSPSPVIPIHVVAGPSSNHREKHRGVVAGTPPPSKKMRSLLSEFSQSSSSNEMSFHPSVPPAKVLVENSDSD